MQVFCDGGARGNPGPGGWAFVVLRVDGRSYTFKGFVEHATNNEMEWEALCQALELACDYACVHESLDPVNVDLVLNIYCDSKLIVEQACHRWKTKDPRMKAYQTRADYCSDLLWKKVGVFTTIRHIPRSENRAADAAVNEVLDANTKA